MIGSGPAGLAAAQQLTRAGHAGHRLRARRPPRRPAALRHPRVQDGEAAPRPPAGPDARPRAPSSCRRDAASTSPSGSCGRFRRDRAGRRRAGAARPAGARPRAGRHLPGDGVPAAGQPGARGDPGSPVTAAGKHVVIIGGGDTGADCLGTAHRQGAASVTQLEIMPRPPEPRPAGHPWPTYPMIYRVSSAHEEGGERVYAVYTEEFVGDADGQVRALRLTRWPSTAAGSRRSGHRAGAPVRPGPAGDGLHRRRAAGPARPTWAWSSTRAATWPATRLRRPRCPACSSRGHGPRPVADRLGDRRGPQRRGRRRPATCAALDRPDLPVAIPPTARPLV